MTDHHSKKTPGPAPSATSDNLHLSQKLPVVGIGASAGGLEAFKVFFGNGRHAFIVPVGEGHYGL